MPSRTIGRYEIEKQLGEGGMAVVYLAHDPNFDRKVVVKVILREYSSRADFRARLGREAKVIAKLEHEAIVPVYDFGEHDGQPYIVMRHMTGGSLADRLKETGPLSLPETARLVERIADALDLAHSKGIIHRDLKPGNLLFDERGRPYLSDFGIAKSYDLTLSLTQGPVGSPPYMSPEQCQGDAKVDGRSDVYSLGVMVYELLSGELPFRAGDAMSMMYAHVHTPPPDIRKTRPELPAESAALIRRALAKRPDDRYKTTTELAAELSRIASKPAPRPVRPVRFEKPDRSSPTPDDLRPTGVIVEPKPSPARQFDALRNSVGQFAKLPYIAPMAAIGLIALILVAALSTLPGLLTQRTPTAQHTNIVAITPSNPTTQPTKTSTPTPRPSNTATAKPPTPTPTLGIGSTQISEKDGMVLVFVPAGKFTMGSGTGYSDERPAHTVRLDDYWIDQTEVTNAMFAKFIAETDYQTDGEKGGCGYVFNPSSESWSCIDGATWDHPQGPGSNLDGLEDHPVVQVSWNDANAYCDWAGRRLPTEAEWEKAARGDDGRIYPWGDDAPAGNLLNFADVNLNTSWADKDVDDGYQLTAPAGSYPDGASPYGALDMAGNVWEWVSSLYQSYPYDAADGRENPDSTDARVRRGGGWVSNEYDVLAAYRNRNVPSLSSNNIGFRCSLSP